MQDFKVIFRRAFIHHLTGILLILGILLTVSSCSNGDATIYTTTTPTTTPIYWPTPSPYLTAPIDISTLSDGQTVRVNLVRFTGTLPSPDATVMVNNSQVAVNDGQYYVYLDLLPGENVIEVKTITGTETETQYVHVFFEPPLVVRLFKPNFDPDVNYLENPLVTIKGDVSNPSAEVLVNGIKQKVQPDGTFSAEVLSAQDINLARAVATLGDEIDTYDFKWGISENGRPYIPPGWASINQSVLIIGDHTATLKAGESTIFHFGVRITTGFPNEGDLIALVANISIKRVSDFQGGSYLPILQSLNIYVESSSYSLYPKIEYYFPIIIETEPDLTPGDYYYDISFSCSNTATSSRLTVSVQ